MRGRTEQRAAKADRGGSWKQFMLFFRKVRLSWGWILLSLGLSLVYYAVVSLVPGNTAELYAGSFSTSAIMSLVLNYVCMLILSLMVSVAQLIAQAKAVRSARHSVWRCMMHVRTSYYNEHAPGRLLSAVTSDTETTVSSLITVIVMIPSAIMYLLMCLAQISVYNRKLMAVLFFLVPVYFLYAVLMGRWQYKTGRAIQMRIGGLTGFLTERIRNLTLIKSFATEQQEEDKGVAAAGDLYRANVQYQYIGGVIAAYTLVTEAIGVVAAVIWGSILLRNGEIELEAWLAFFLFVPMINTALRQLSMMWSNIKEVQGRASRMGALIDAPQEELNKGSAQDIPQGDLVFSNVGYSYTPDRPVLHNIDLMIPRGKVTAIVGPSGSGKTTLLKLLERLYDPDQGSLSVGGQDLTTLNLQAWRAQLSYVTQDSAVFSGTLRDCLTYGIDRQVTDEELEQVTRQAGLYDFVSAQPEKFDAPLAIWGSALSGGQRQRLVIARELLRNTDILLLDEPTSALDTATAQSVSNLVYRQFRGKTIVTVTHELNFIAGADQIVVLNHGSIEAVGTHDQLMQSCELYRDLMEQQSYEEVFGA